MDLCTPEQFRLFRHRSVGAFLIEIVALILAPIAAVSVMVILGEQAITSRITGAVVFVAIFLAGQAWRRNYFRCPVCAEPLSRGQRHVPFGQAAVNRCSHCGTCFAAPTR